jgi:hypothetical protein
MKKIHTLCATPDNLRPAMQYFEISNGYVYGTDAHILGKIPQNEVFGTEFFPTDKKFYIEGKQWKAQKLFNAVSFQPVDNFEASGMLLAFDKKGQTLGICQFYTESDFMHKVGKFPNCEQIIYKEDAVKQEINAIGFNPELYNRLTEALEDKVRTFKLSFFGQNKAILVQHIAPDTHTKGIGIMMPLMIG